MNNDTDNRLPEPAEEQSALQSDQSTQLPQEQIKTLLKLPIPIFVVAAYLVMGFLWDLWHPGWMLFFAIPVYYELVSMLATREIRKKLNRFPIAVLCVAAYLLLGFYLDLWHPGWIIFLLIPLYHTTVSAVFRK